MKVQLFVLVVVMQLLGAGCATLTKGSSQTVTINTEPAGATCTLSRDGKSIAVVNPTPGSIPVEKAAGTISVICKKPSYQDAAGVLASEFQAMTFGNILFGGLIGVVVDAASGAMNQYPDMVTITMVPQEFASPEARDRFFDDMKSTLLRESAEVKARIAAMCKPENCASELAAADAGTKAKLAEIEERRLLARSRGTAMAPPTPAPTPPPAADTGTTAQPQPPSPTAPSTTAPAPSSAPPQASPGVSTQSRYAYNAEQLAKANGCKTPATTMNFAGAGVETFTVTCGTEEPLSIRCDYGNCRIMK